jgi:hypothetical protein
MECKTREGISYFMLGTVISIFCVLGSAIISTNYQASCLIGIASFFSLIFILIGLGLMFLGRKEFGDEHRQFVTYAAIAFLLGIAIFVLGTFLMVGGALSEVTSTPGTQDQTIDHSKLVQDMTNGLIVIQFGSVVLLLGEILLVYKLEDHVGKDILYGVFAIGIRMAIASTIMYSSTMNEFMVSMKENPFGNPEEKFVEFEKDINRIALLSLITTFLLLIAYYIPYERIKNGELVPELPTSSDYGGPAYPPQYPDQPHPPQYPSQLPPPPQDLNIAEGEPLPPPPPPSTKEKTQMIEMKICPHCGLRCLDGWGPCPFCGK